MADIADPSILAVRSEQGESGIGPLDHMGRSALQGRLYTVGELLRMDQLSPDPDRSNLNPQQLDIFDQGAQQPVRPVRGTPPPPYRNSKGCWCLSHVGGEGVVADIADPSILAVRSEQGESGIGPLDHMGRSALQGRLYTVGELLRMDQLSPDPDRSNLNPQQLDIFDQGAQQPVRPVRGNTTESL